MTIAIIKSTILGLLSLALFVSCQKEDEPLLSPSGNKESSKPVVQLASFLKSDEISLDLAQRIVRSKGGSNLRSFSAKEIKSKYSISEGGENLIYILNYKPTGYALISATRSYTPILAYSDTGEINPDDMSPNLAYIVDGYKQEIKKSKSLPDSVKRRYAIEWEVLNPNKTSLRSLVSQAYLDEQLQRLKNEGYTIYDYKEITSCFNPYLNREELQRLFSTPGDHLQPFNPTIFMIVKREAQDYSVKPLLSTRWGQTTPWGANIGYNKYSPLYNASNPRLAPIGCVAVAVGQIMHYHKYPQIYKWSEMPNTYATDATARFLYEVARGVKMEFGYTESSAKFTDAAYFLRSLGYDVGVKDFSGAEAMRQIKSGNPVYVRGEERLSGEGHAFVADGYDASYSHERVRVIDINESAVHDAVPEYYQVLYEKASTPHHSVRLHLNLGWGGISDGYYASRDLCGYNNRNIMLTIRKK